MLEPGDVIYASYPRKRREVNQTSVLHDHDWVQAEASQQQIWRKRFDDSGQHYIDITPQVQQLRTRGKRIEVEMRSGKLIVAEEEARESSPGMLIGTVNKGDADAK